MDLDRILHEPWSLPSRGVQVVAVDFTPAAARLVAGHVKSGALRGNVYFAETAGLVRYADGTWRAFPLESGDSFAIRTCDGEFVARVLRDPRSAERSSLAMQLGLD